MASWPRGKQSPEKYPKVGPRYKKWGEQTQRGYGYDPSTDTYYELSPEERARLQKETEKAVADPPPKQPSIWEQGLAATAPALAGRLGLLAFESLLNKPTVISTIGNQAIMSDGTVQSLDISGASNAAAGLLGIGTTPDFSISSPNYSLNLKLDYPSLSLPSYSPSLGASSVQGIGPVASGAEYGNMLGNSSTSLTTTPTTSADSGSFLDWVGGYTGWW